MYIHHIFFTHSSVDGQLDCFHILAIIHNAAMNIMMHVSFLISIWGFFFFLVICPAVKLVGHMVVIWASLVAQVVKNPPAMWETWVQSLGWEDPLEEGMATHSSVLGWRIPWPEEPGGCSPWDHTASDAPERLSTRPHGSSLLSEPPGESFCF